MRLIHRYTGFYGAIKPTARSTQRKQDDHCHAWDQQQEECKTEFVGVGDKQAEIDDRVETGNHSQINKVGSAWLAQRGADYPFTPNDIQQSE